MMRSRWARKGWKLPRMSSGNTSTRKTFRSGCIASSPPATNHDQPRRTPPRQVTDIDSVAVPEHLFACGLVRQQRSEPERIRGIDRQRSCSLNLPLPNK